MQDPMLEEIWRVRDELIRRHGGVHGYLNYLRERDRKRVSKAKRKLRQKRVARTTRNGRATKRATAKV
jgi:hypothetical protein